MSRFSPSRSTCGGVPMVRPWMRDRYSLAPNSSVQLPRRTMASPSRAKPARVTQSRFSMSPTMPTVGVGKTAEMGLSL